MITKMTWADFSARYCRTQVSTPDEMVNANNARLDRQEEAR